MARPQGAYSQIIAWLKILLPLAALTLLSTLFLLSKSRTPDPQVPFAIRANVGESLQQQASAPYFAGTTESGDVLTMRALSVKPIRNGEIVAEDLQAQLDLQAGTVIELNAARATLLDLDQTAHLTGGVLIETSLGYRIETQALDARMDQTFVRSVDTVQATGPLGTLTAGGMQISAGPGQGDAQMLFTGGVKLVYDPTDPEKEAQ